VIRETIFESLVTGVVEDVIRGTGGTGKVGEMAGCEISGSLGTGKIGVVAVCETLVGTGIGGTSKVVVNSVVLEGGTSVAEVVFEIPGLGVTEDMIGGMGGTGKVGEMVTGWEVLESLGTGGTGKVGVVMGCGVGCEVWEFTVQDTMVEVTNQRMRTYQARNLGWSLDSTARGQTWLVARLSLVALG
jgi:hypothetical protein